MVEGDCIVQATYGISFEGKLRRARCPHHAVIAHFQ